MNQKEMTTKQEVAYLAWQYLGVLVCAALLVKFSW